MYIQGLQREVWKSSAHVNLFSRCSAAMYSPCASLNMFLMRSTTFSVPAGVSSPTSPLWKKPSESAGQILASKLCHLQFRHRIAAARQQEAGAPQGLASRIPTCRVAHRKVLCKSYDKPRALRHGQQYRQHQGRQTIWFLSMCQDCSISDGSHS